MPSDDLDALFGEVTAEIEGGSDGANDSEPEVDEPDTESADVDESGDGTDVDTDDDVDAGDDVDETDNSDETGGDAWNWEDFSDQLVPRTVNGQTEMVTLKEAIQGSMRQADYTQKTQQLSEYQKAAKWAEDVQAAFQRDPMGTLEAFAQAYGLLDAEQQQQEQSGLEELDEDIRPWAEKVSNADRRIAELEQRLQAQENERLKAEIRMELDGLANRFGDDFDKAAVLQTAAQKNLGLEDAYWFMVGQRTLQQQSQQSEADRAAQAAGEAKRQAAEQARKQNKKAASGTSTKSFKASDIPVDDFDDIGELFEQVAASS